MADPDLLQRMDGFESRLNRMEELLGLHKPPVVPPPTPVFQPKLQIVQQMWATPVKPAVAPEDPLDVLELADADPAPAPSPQAARHEPPPIPVVAYQQRAPLAPLREPGLEQTIGLKWAGWVGAVVLVIGAALGIKYGYDQGWFHILPPALRVALMAMGGFAMLGAGEWVYRKVNKLSAAGLFGAGVAVLFVVSYAGYAYYHLYLRNTAFAFMGVCTIIGALIARRGQLVSIAVLSLIGGNLAPVLLHSQTPELTGLLVYLLMLQGVSLALARWGGMTKWWTLRGLSLATTSLWMAAVIDMEPRSTLITFAIIFASLFQLELLVTSLRSKLTIARAGATFSLLVTASLSAALLYLLRDYDQTTRLITVLGMAAVAGVGALVCLRSRNPSTATRELGLGFTIQAVALVIVAVPVAFSGVWIAATWGVLAIALAVMGYMLELPMARYAAPLVWLLAVGELFSWTAALEISNTARQELLAANIDGIDLSKTTLMSWLLALLGLVIAKFFCLRRNSTPTETSLKLGLALGICSTGLWLAASLLGLPAMPATASILIYIAILTILDLIDRDLQLLQQAAVLLVLATLKWALIDTLGTRMFGNPATEPLLLSIRGLTSMLLLLAPATVWHRANQTVESNEYSRFIKRITSALVVGIIFWLGTFSIDQAL